MGFLANLLKRVGDEYEEEAESGKKESADSFPDLYNGMKLEVETPEGTTVLSGRISGYSEGDTELTVERMPGGLSFKVLELGAAVQIRGYTESMIQFVLVGEVQESSRVIFRVRDVKVKPIPELRQNFRLRVNAPAVLYHPSDEKHNNPEECTLVDISAGGACLESEYLHGMDEVLRLRVKLEDYVPMEYTGEIIRVVERGPQKFRYGFLFAQLEESELTDLTRTLYNIQVGERLPWMRYDKGYW